MKTLRKVEIFLAAILFAFAIVNLKHIGDLKAENKRLKTQIETEKQSYNECLDTLQESLQQTSKAIEVAELKAKQND